MKKLKLSFKSVALLAGGYTLAWTVILAGVSIKGAVFTILLYLALLAVTKLEMKRREIIDRKRERNRYAGKIELEHDEMTSRNLKFEKWQRTGVF